MTVHRSARVLPVALLLALALPTGARSQSSPGWTPAMVGIRFGYQDRSGSSVLGGQLHLPVLPSGFVELMPNGSITFLHGLKEREYALDVVFVSGGRHGGLMVGAGPAARNSVFGDGTTRETRKGWDLLVGLKTMPGESLPVGIQLEERWIFMRLPVNPRVLSFGVNVPLWGWGHFR